MLTTNDDDDAGYETDATVRDEDYDSEKEREFNANRKRKMSTPSTPQAMEQGDEPFTPEAMEQGPEPSTEILKKTGSPMYTEFEGMRVPYTRNSVYIGQIPLDRNGKNYRQVSGANCLTVVLPSQEDDDAQKNHRAKEIRVIHANPHINAEHGLHVPSIRRIVLCRLLVGINYICN